MRPEVTRGALAAAALLLVAAAGAVDLNTASRAELERLDGFGVATAAQVIAAREQRPFADWNDFSRRIKGIKAQRLEQLRRQGATIQGELPPTAATTK